MRSALVVVVVLILAAVAALGETYNLTITDHRGSVIRWFPEVRLYTVDETTDDRLAEEPVVVLEDPADPIRLLLEPGRYEFVVWDPWLPREVSFFYFDIEDGRQAVINVQSYELPEELVVR